MLTIAQRYDSQPLESYEGPVVYSSITGIYTFPDGSKAKVITKIETCKPYMKLGVTTSKKEVKYWVAI